MFIYFFLKYILYYKNIIYLHNQLPVQRSIDFITKKRKLQEVC